MPPTMIQTMMAESTLVPSTAAFSIASSLSGHPPHLRRFHPATAP
jgi:hypothetical protein